MILRVEIEVNEMSNDRLCILNRDGQVLLVEVAEDGHSLVLTKRKLIAKQESAKVRPRRDGGSDSVRRPINEVKRAA
jgi:hypothetical protein